MSPPSTTNPHPSASPPPTSPPFVNNHSSPSSAMPTSAWLSTRRSRPFPRTCLGFNSSWSPPNLSRTDNGRTLGYIAYQIYVLVRSAQLDLADLVSLISLLDIPFTDLIWIPALLVALESTLAIPFLAQKVHRFGRKALQWVQFMALGGVLVTTLPHLACIVVGFAVPIIIDHILRQARKIERFLNRVVRTVVDIGTRSVVLVLRSHWAIVGRVAYNVYCLLATIAFSSTFLESIATAFDVPAADLIWLPALLFALESTPRILFLSHKLYRYGRRILRLIDIAMTFAGVVVTMLPHFLCVVLGLVMPFAVRHGIHTLRKMDRFLVRIVHAAIAAFVCAIRAGSSVTERLSFAVQDLCRTASRFVRLFITATHPCLRIVVLHLYYLAARYLYRAKRIRAISKKLLRLVVAQVSVITDIALRVVAWVGRIAKPSASPVMAQMPCITNDLLELEPTAAPVPFKKRNRADKRYQRGKKLHVDVEEKGKRKRA
ncbi:hypothetical protein C8F01DRAFT_275491 [Mycena amicta]|nr:hypothetical protein C8F01DRAFT_275491 [Mycena amicta]